MDLESDVRIGDFRILKRLGAGGMGVVYKARQISLDRVVALKVLGSALNRESDIARFQREAQAIARLDHPSIAGVHFIGQDDRVCYMAMEFIDGVSLREVLDRLAATTNPHQTLDSLLGALSTGEQDARALRFDQPTETHIPQSEVQGINRPDGSGVPSANALCLITTTKYIRRCAEIVRSVALALAHAHERGVVHRDIKPENLLIDRDGRITVIDFGIARFFEDMTLTGTGMLVGTPIYMSPEQVTGRLEVDHRSDIYSLGLVLYELLTLQRPTIAPTREAVLRQIVTKALPPVSRRNSSISRDLEAIVHKATAKDPEERYQVASEFAADLESWLAGKQVVATPYRYKFDNKQLAAERPMTVVFAAFGFFSLALICIPFIMDGIWGEINNYNFIYNKRLFGSNNIFDTPPNAADLEETNKHFDPRFIYNMYLQENWPFIALLFFATVIAPVAIWIGRGLLVGSTAAVIAGRTLLAVVLTITIIPFLFFDKAERATLFGLSYYLAPFIPVTAVTPFLLHHRKTRDWFRLASRLRAEHSKDSPT